MAFSCRAARSQAPRSRPARSRRGSCSPRSAASRRPDTRGSPDDARREDPKGGDSSAQRRPRARILGSGWFRKPIPIGLEGPGKGCERSVWVILQKGVCPVWSDPFSGWVFSLLGWRRLLKRRIFQRDPTLFTEAPFVRSVFHPRSAGAFSKDGHADVRLLVLSSQKPSKDTWLLGGRKKSITLILPAYKTPGPRM